MSATTANGTSLTQVRYGYLAVEDLAHPEVISPDAWESVDGFMRKANEQFLRGPQPTTSIFKGRDDPFSTPDGGEAYLQDLPQAETHRLNAGHFATEDNPP